MIQEDKELLLKDLCSRLPYNVKGRDLIDDIDITIVGIDRIYSDDNPMITTIEPCDYIYLFDIKPYLRPLSSMTEKEKIELEYLGFRYESGFIINEDANEYDFCEGHPYTMVDETKCFDIIEFLSSRHFDYHELIKKGLALEAPKGMYEY